MTDMNTLKIIFYGFLTFAQKYPFFTLAFLAAVILPPIFFPAVRWFMLGMFIIALIVIGLIWLQFYRMKRQMEKEYRDAMNGKMGGNNAGPGAGFTGYGFARGMRLEDFVQQMQQQADARQTGTQQQTQGNASAKSQKKASDQGEYVDFEEIK